MTRLVTLRDLDRDWPGRWNLGAAMELPVPTIHVHHTVTEDTGDPIADARTVHDIDQKRFGKISYSWLVHESSGSWIEGETVHRGAHTINNARQSLNGISFGIGVIGNFHPAAPIPPPRPASDELVQLIAAGIREFIVTPGHVSRGFGIDGHRDVFATACCGDNLYDRLPIIRTYVSSPPARKDPKMLALIVGDNDPDQHWWITDYVRKWHVPPDAAGVEVLAEIATSLRDAGVTFERDDHDEHPDDNKRIVGSRPISRTQALVDAIPVG